MKTAYIKQGRRHSRVTDVREATISDLIAVGLDPSRAHLYLVGSVAGDASGPRLVRRDTVVESREHLAIQPRLRSPGEDEWYWAVQYVDTFATESEADDAVRSLSTMDGFIAGRTIKTSPSKPGWRAQVFFEDETPPTGGEILPDNLRRVRTNDAMLSSFMRRD
jgi:hypothetical protein